MDASEALNELGLSTPASAEAIRRAYLRAVRVHPPERDPDGFRRIREAYELLKDSPWLWHAERPARVASDSAPGDGVTSNLRVIPSAEEEGVLPPPDEDDVAPASDESGDIYFGPPGASEELSAAIERGDFEGAANLLLESMTAKEGELAISHWQVLHCVLGLFEAGNGGRARELLAGLDAWTERQGLHPGQIGAAASARWKLAKELAALHGGVDDEVVQRLAKAVESGQFFLLRDLLERQQKADRHFRNTMKHLAPTLFAAVRPSAPEIQLSQSFREPRSGWNYVWIAFVFVQCVRLIAHTTSSETKTEAAAPAPKSEALTNPEAAHFQRINIEGIIDESGRKGACNEVRALWPQYVELLHRVGRGAAVDESYKTRRLTVVTQCSELDKELPERP